MSYSIETPRLWLEPLSVDKHFDDFWELWSDKDAVKWTWVHIHTFVLLLQSWEYYFEFTNLDYALVILFLLRDYWHLPGPRSNPTRSQHAPRFIREEALAFMLEILPNAKNPDIEKFAVLLRPVPDNPEPWTNAKGQPKMIGMTGTNRMSVHGMETGYFFNAKYYGKGYAGEAFSAFLKFYWSLPERMNFPHLVAKVDPGNIASEKIVMRVGARRGELLKEAYARKTDDGIEKRDAYCWYIDRPAKVVNNTSEQALSQ
ncbi:putative N-acetyltransferase [Lachnellula suecica]|uniref:Putative N-acetyltransferase n=1 Tax=Lachnellula suecica TaxID=602035 RepID=A0A8T9BSM7_9HELO|nr:putative N-acetyltransferase [Lachnellula suecica]